MSLHDDLLSQARELVTKDPMKPKQANLRRAISSAYYALFHLLVHEGSRYLVSDRTLSQMVARAFIHGVMKKASKAFSGGTLPLRLSRTLGDKPVPKELQWVAQAFVELQQARHEADYDIGKSFTRAGAQALVDQAEKAFKDWSAIQDQSTAKVFLVSLLLNDRLEKVT